MCLIRRERPPTHHMRPNLPWLEGVCAFSCRQSAAPLCKPSSRSCCQALSSFCYRFALPLFAPLPTAVLANESWQASYSCCPCTCTYAEQLHMANALPATTSKQPTAWLHAAHPSQEGAVCLWMICNVDQRGWTRCLGAGRPKMRSVADKGLRQGFR